MLYDNVGEIDTGASSAIQTGPHAAIFDHQAYLPRSAAHDGGPGSGTFFDEQVSLREPEQAVFNSHVLELYESVRPRNRRRNRDALANHTIRIQAILANAMRVYHFRKIPGVLYFRKADASWYDDAPSWMRHGALGEAVDALADAGLLDRVKGKLMPAKSQTPSWTSSYVPTQKLIGLASQCGVSAASVDIRVLSPALVRLFSAKPKPVYDFDKGGLIRSRKGKLIDFEPTDETIQWTATLANVNAFYREQDISLGLSPEQLVQWTEQRNAHPDRTGSPYRVPEMFQTDIYRVFNNGTLENPSFSEGGRLFGGWWMSVPEHLRKAIIINGQKTKEVDYAECHARMLYHKMDLAGEGKLYRLPELTAFEEHAGIPTDTHRPFVKWLMQVLINCKGRPEAVEIPQHLSIPSGYTIKEIVGFIVAKHKAIADAFKTGAGMHLMRLESDIALEIISTAMAEGWTALSVHDSFIAPVDRYDRLQTLMIDTYARRIGRRPLLKTSDEEPGLETVNTNT